MNEAPPARRRVLGAALRRYRANAGYGLDDAARILDCDRSKISRIETGRRGIRPGDLRELLSEYGVPEKECLALAAIARHNDQRGWWQSDEQVLPGACQDFIMESEAASVRAYAPQRVPALLQTRDYARALAAASVEYVTPEQQDQFVAARLGRQRVLLDGNPPQLWAIISEVALHQAVGGAEVMIGQLERIAEASQGLPSVTVQVLPFASRAHAAASGPFSVLRFPEAPKLRVVYLEGQTGGVYLEREADVARYNLLFEHLQASALSMAASRSLISDVAGKYGDFLPALKDRDSFPRGSGFLFH